MAHEQLDALVEQGVNFIDTAELYPVPFEGGKVTEEWIGHWLEGALAAKKIQRDQNPSNNGAPDMKGRKKPWGFDQESLLASCKASIERLKCQYIDLYYLHWPTRNVPVFGCISYFPDKNRPVPSFDKGEVKDFEAQVLAIKALFDAGLIKHWALSNENNYGVTMFCLTCDRLNVPRPVCVQNDYSLNNRIFDTAPGPQVRRDVRGLRASDRKVSRTATKLATALAWSAATSACSAEATGLADELDLDVWRVKTMRFEDPTSVLSGKYIRDSPYAKKDPGRDLGECRHHARPNFQPRYSYPMPAKATERYVVLAEKYGLTPTELAVAWAPRSPRATVFR
ncbi:Protein tas [Durusdinium trenchii]|uniref:Protein tas n=1 Tax=Durusdinium trenchii TaxID=1381693 RepID=A0ABP0S627_9DINO